MTTRQSDEPDYDGFTGDPVSRDWPAVRAWLLAGVGYVSGVALFAIGFYALLRGEA